MGLIVQKFGGTSVADADRIRNVARIITETYRRGHNVLAVLSAQGDTTDDLIAKAAQINPHASKREMDMLLSLSPKISSTLSCLPQACVAEFFGNSVDQDQQNKVDNRVKQAHCRGKAVLVADHTNFVHIGRNNLADSGV